MIKGICYKCSSELSFDSIVGRRDECSSCSENIHVCKNCEFYDEKSYNECRETSADPVKDKEAANFCDYFKLGNNEGGDHSKGVLVSAAEALFKK